MSHLVQDQIGGGTGSGFTETVKTASTSSFISFTGLTGASYELQGHHIVTSASTTAYLEVSDDNGATWKTGAVYLSNITATNQPNASQHASESNGVRVLFGSGGQFFKMYFAGLDNASLKHPFIGHVSYMSTASINLSGVIGGVYNTAGVIDAIRIIPSTGTITSGTFTLREY